MSYGWENDDSASDVVARGGSMVRDRLLKEIEGKNRQISLLKEKVADFESFVVEIEANKKEISELKDMLIEYAKVVNKLIEKSNKLTGRI